MIKQFELIFFLQSWPIRQNSIQISEWKPHMITVMVSLCNSRIVAWVNIYLIEKRYRLKSINYERYRYDPLDFWDAQKRASILIQRARFNDRR